MLFSQASDFIICLDLQAALDKPSAPEQHMLKNKHTHKMVQDTSSCLKGEPPHAIRMEQKLNSCQQNTYYKHIA